MKKNLFGYNVSEVNVVISALREENESLNATITTLRNQMKNGINGNGAKVNLLEADLKKNEGELKRVQEENNELISKISSLTMDAEVLKQQNKELTAQTKQIHMPDILQSQLAATSDAQDITVQVKEIRIGVEELQNSAEELSAVRGDLYKNIPTPSPLPAKEMDEHLDAVLKDNEHLVDELRRVKKELESISAVLDSRNEELTDIKEKLSFTNAALNTTKAALETAIDQTDKFQKEKQPININKASEISYQAYYEMSRMRNEVVEFMHQQTKEYYQLINDNNLKIRSTIECRQQEYNQMVREFFTNASEFRNRLSNMEVECSNIVDFNMKIDQVSKRMKEIMDQFMNECDASIRD
ncbi:MAG: hypothetical protein K0R46_567 [Herbinix sp.]|jgi:chromosome segregation ATPase|nr:hypothetical protein [Herbinix sp.]